MTDLLSATGDSRTFKEMINRLNEIGGEPRCTALIMNLYIEDLMDAMLVKKMKKSEEFFKRMSFSDKLSLIESLNFLPSSLINDLKIINQIHNQFAYEIDIESQEFENKFRQYLEKLQYYHQDQSKFAKISSSSSSNTYPVVVMMMLYYNLKAEFDKLG